MNGVNKDTSFVVSPSPWFNGTPRLTMQNSAALWTNCQPECKDSLEDVDFSQKIGHCENVRRGADFIRNIFHLFNAMYSENSLSFIQISYPEKQRFDGGFHLCLMFCDVVFDHLVVMRHNGGCSQQVTTEGHGSNLLITHQLLICVKDNKNLKSCHRYYITTSLSSSSSSTRIDDKSLDYIVGQSIHDLGTDISFHRFGGWGLN